jgi:hypothetical protein
MKVTTADSEGMRVLFRAKDMKANAESPVLVQITMEAGEKNPPAKVKAAIDPIAFWLNEGSSLEDGIALADHLNRLVAGASLTEFWDHEIDSDRLQ